MRSRAELLGWIREAGLAVVGRADTQPKHGKVFDKTDPLHGPRSRETTSLRRLQLAVVGGASDSGSGGGRQGGGE